MPGGSTTPPCSTRAPRAGPTTTSRGSPGWRENQHIDGLYLDDIAFSRETVKRLVTVLHEHRDEVVIDLHSANQFNVRDGFINSAMLYMEHFPFISRLWFGEYFDYDQGPDYWMTEVAGPALRPHGRDAPGRRAPVPGHALRDDGPEVRRRRPPPRLGHDERLRHRREPHARATGWRTRRCRPINPQVLATTYVRPDGVLIALASWSETDEVVDLKVDFEALGLEEGVQAHCSIGRGFTGGQRGEPLRGQSGGRDGNLPDAGGLRAGISANGNVGASFTGARGRGQAPPLQPTSTDFEGSR